MPLDPFTVNLADREAERYAQVGITLELEDAKAGDQIKAYMPVIRNNILMVLAHKTAGRTAGARRQAQLAAEIRREACARWATRSPCPRRPRRPSDEAEDPKKKKRRRARRALSNFIDQYGLRP